MEVFGSEFVAARIATDQIIDPRYTLMYLGVLVRSISYMFHDNKSVVDSQAYPPPVYPRNQLWLHIIESEKPLLQDISNSTGMMENPTLQTSSANFGSLQTSGLSCCLYSSGWVTHMSSLPRQRGVTEFQPKSGGFSLTLMDQGQTNNPECSYQ